ncbi:MAG: zinc-ribbon domain-containing protein [Sphingorhabdus sp.]
MLLICPECRTRYVVPDSAIGATGRQVRCANCRHSWHQGGTIMPPAPPAPAIVAPAIRKEETGADATPSFFERSSPAGEEAAKPGTDPATENTFAPAPGFKAFEDAVPPPAKPDLPPRFDQPVTPPPPTYTAPLIDDLPSRSQFVHEPPFRPRRNPAKIMTYAAIAFAVVIAVLGFATWYFGWFDNSFASTAKEPDLTIVLHDNLELGRDADGSPYFIASGTIVNPTATTQDVPELLVTLKDAGGRSVYSWTMRAPVRSLEPGAKTDFSQLRRDVPLAASRISVGWALGGK